MSEIEDKYVGLFVTIILESVCGRGYLEIYHPEYPASFSRVEIAREQERPY